MENIKKRFNAKQATNAALDAINISLAQFLIRVSPGTSSDFFDKSFITVPFFPSFAFLSREYQRYPIGDYVKKLNEFRLDSIESKLGTEGTKFNELTLHKFEKFRIVNYFNTYIVVLILQNHQTVKSRCSS